jgi:hypothetical protein
VRLFSHSSQALALAAALLGAALVQDEAVAKAPPVVVLGEVETLESARSLRPVLRTMLEEELRATDFGKGAFKKRYIVDASLLKLDSSSKRTVSTSSCEVSTLLRTDRDGEIVATIHGRATAEKARNAASETRTEALRAAARSAIGKIPRAIRASERMR